MTSMFTDPDVTAIQSVTPHTPNGCEECLQRHAVGASSVVPDVRARRLLRLVADATCQEPRPHHRAPYRAIHGAR